MSTQDGSNNSEKVAAHHTPRRFVVFVIVTLAIIIILLFIFQNGNGFFAQHRTGPETSNGGVKGGYVRESRGTVTPDEEREFYQMRLDALERERALREGREPGVSGVEVPPAAGEHEFNEEAL